ncbi:hypothetical protein FHS96_005287 [Sphingomonas zeicaulis]
MKDVSRQFDGRTSRLVRLGTAREQTRASVELGRDEGNMILRWPQP